MKELSIEEKAKRYDKAIERARIWKNKSGMPKDKQGILDDIFPELIEVEDERIKKVLKRAISVAFDYSYFDKETAKNCLAWLEKQGEQKHVDDLTQQEAMDIAVAKCFEQGEQKPVENRQETKPNGGIVSEDFNDGDGYYKVNLAYLSKSQVELIENLVVSWQTSANNSVKWSEEDIRNIENIDSVLFYDKDLPEDTCVRLRNWLKSLKQRIGG